MRVADAFSAARWRVCWATTYTFEPAFFEAFLMRRLGDPPLNVVVLGDAARLAETWDAIGPHDAWRVPGLNQRYLARGVNLSGGAFHAKTILLGNEKRGALLVGSGNLGLSGIERGNEVYARLDRDVDPVAFAVWRDWMAGIVTFLDDPLLRSRWADLLARLPWLGQIQGGTPSAFVTNSAIPILESFLAGIAAPADELHVTAPFFDHALVALGELIAATRPRRLVLYVGEGMSVDGERLARALDGMSGEVRIVGYTHPVHERAVYVHAKAIAVITGSRARLLAGSANLSAPALLSASWAGNVEAGIVRDLAAEDARAFFGGGDRFSLVDLDIEQVRGFQLATMQDGPGHPLRLVSASRGRDGVISVVVDGDAPVPMVLTDGRSSTPVVDSRTADALGGSEGSQLVWLVTPTGDVLSNRVPVDDVQALERILNVQQSTGEDRPRELDPLDIRHPLGRILFDLHRIAVFDVDDSPASRRLEAAKSAEATDPDADAFWNRFFREELGRDPRTARYHGLGRGRAGDDAFLDEFGALLLQMLDRAPALGQLRLLDGTVISRVDGDGEGVQWTDARRVRLRAYNVLARWATAISDPRVRWFGDLAPVRHYEALLGALAQIWPQARADLDEDRWLTFDQLSRLFSTLHGAFVRTDRSIGYLAGTDEEERAEVLDHLRAQGAPALAAALAYDALRNGRPATFFTWQPFLVPALEWGVIVADTRSCDYLRDGLGINATVEDVDRVLHRAAAYIDDEHWCSQVALSLGLDGLSIGRSGNPHYPVEIVLVDGFSLRNDPRIPGLIRLTLGYAKSPFRLRSGTDVVAVALGQTLAARFGGEMDDSLEPLTETALDDLERDGNGLGTLFDSEESIGVA